MCIKKTGHFFWAVSVSTVFTTRHKIHEVAQLLLVKSLLHDSMATGM